MKLINYAPLSDAWFDYRRSRITGTDVPGILGLSSYKTPLSVWMEKTGKQVNEREETDLMTWGRYMEEAARKWTAADVPCIIRPFTQIAQHDQLDWFCCTPDGIIQKLITDDVYEDVGTWEGKCPSQWKRTEWEEGMPEDYQVQVLAALAVTGFEQGILSALFQPEIRWGRVERNETLIEQMMNRLVDFWEGYVLKDIPPPASASSEDTRILKELHPQDTGEVISVRDNEIIATTRRVLHLQDEEKKIKKEVDELRNRIRQWMGPASYAACPDGGGWSYVRNAKGVRVLTYVNRIPHVKEA